MWCITPNSKEDNEAPNCSKRIDFTKSFSNPPGKIPIVDCVTYAVQNTDGTLTKRYGGYHYTSETTHQTGNCTITDYAPSIFRHIRKTFEVDEAYVSMTLLPPQGGAGKSGSLFMNSKDNKFVIKTVDTRRGELKLLKEILGPYHQYITNNKNSLLVRFYGLFKVHNTNQIFVVMDNVFANSPNMDLIFDLKGSKVGRAASKAEQKKDTPVYKDLDFEEQKVEIGVGSVNAYRLKAQIKRDCEFLRQINVMDYSLLVGIKETKMTSWYSFRYSKNLRCVIGTSAVYYLGIIDFLQLYNRAKKFEHFVKGDIQHRSQSDKISVLPPDQYKERMIDILCGYIH